ncbi:TlpA family protein disulfide reductase [Lacinutrix jangbogonensis]|uniref:TlpA family protein disulfide reductase n=1 Tax=Lacinutrix jangbogonensis TaxID=1469557 RepID=UPI00068A588A|nr:TlpA disulfide reductase family protein [Lacinutrix jangbogonensis]
MKHLPAGLLLLVLLVFSCKTEEKEIVNTLTIGDFEMSTDVVTHNKPITITYNGEDKNMEGLYYMLNGYKAYPYDLDFENGKATLSIPDSVSAIALNLKVDGDYLNNDKKGYLFPVLDKAGNAIIGSNSSIEAFRSGNGQSYGLEGDADALAEAMEADLTANPELKALWGIRYLSNVIRSDSKKGKALASTMLAELASKKELSEEDYSQIRNIYGNLRNTKGLDSIAEIAMTKFPKGKLKQASLMDNFYDAKTLAEKETVFNTIETSFGVIPSLSYAARAIAVEKFKAGDHEGFKTYASKIKGASDKAGLYNSVAWPAAEKGENMEMASQLSKTSLDLLMEAKKDVANKPTYYTEKQYVKSMESTYSMYADTYALLQYKLGNIKEAIKYQAEAIGDGRSSDVNDRYIEFLVTDKQYKLATDKAKAFLSEGNGSSKMKAAYKTAYSSLNPDAKDFETILSGIDKINHDRELAELKESMLDEDAPQFTLKNLDGEDIALASLKGKTVILDFWATWCGPCKASFPSMQQVVEKYKDNEDVVLLFVDTFEDGKNREKDVAKFITDNNYDFHVLIDGKVKDSNDYEVAKKYGITGIPTKIIIGPSGKINFRAVGFNGNNDKLKQEMDMMIDLLKS